MTFESGDEEPSPAPARRTTKSASRKAPSVPLQRHSPEDIAMARILHRHTLLMSIVDRCGRIGMIAAFAVPLWFMQPMVSDLAGKTTSINAVMTASLVTNIALAGGNAIQYSRRRSQGREIRRQRERTDTLETQVGRHAEAQVTEGGK